MAKVQLRTTYYVIHARCKTCAVYATRNDPQVATIRSTQYAVCNTPYASRFTFTLLIDNAASARKIAVKGQITR